MLLTKSDYMIGLQCPKYLWIKKNQPETLPQNSMATQHRFDQGHLIGQFAQKLFASGKLVQGNFSENIEKTKQFIEQKQTIFEAGILAGDLYSRADILEPEWNIYEVKSSTSVKEEHILDVAFQKYVYEKAGLNIQKCFLIHINNQYVKQGEIKPNELFIKADITEEVSKELPNVEPNISRIFKFLALKNPPEFQLIYIENSFYGNPVIDEFMDSLPDENVFQLYRGGKKCTELFGKKICKLIEIPDDYRLTAHQQIQKQCAKTGKPHINKEKLSEFIGSLKYPLCFLDFETFNTALPLFDGTKPYQQIPFQYSLHIVDKETRHLSFLAEGKQDPRKNFLQSLKSNLGSEGSIIVYNQSFEIGRLKELAEIFPEEQDWINSVIARIVDLIIPFRKFYYYNPKQKGSASIKDVLPAMTGKSYDELEITNGEDAGIMFLAITFGDVEDEKVRNNLLEYCKLDTEGMIWILDELKKVTNLINN